MGRLTVRVQPRSRKNEIAGERAGEGRVSIVRGESSRDKLLEVEAIGDDELRRALRAS